MDPRLMPNLRYIIMRLRAMSPLELLWRSVCRIRDRREIRRRVEDHRDFTVRYDIEPGQAVSFIHADRLLPDFAAGAISDVYRERFSKEQAIRLNQADDCLKHRFSIFGSEHTFAHTIDWHLDWLSGQSIPVRPRSHYDLYADRSITEVKYTWEFNRHAHFFTLALAWSLTGDTRYLNELQAQWLHWIETNPLYFGINWISALEVGFRLINWTYALALIKPAPVSKSFFSRVLHSVEQHAEFIAEHPSRFSSANNHLLGEAAALMVAGVCYPGLLNEERWRKNGFKLLFEELPAQVHSDGMTKEQSAGYQRYVLEFGLLGLRCAGITGKSVPERLPQGLRRMTDACLALQDANGRVPNIGDADDGSAFPFSSSDRPLYHDVLNSCAVRFESGQYKQSGSPEAVFWLNGSGGLQAWDALQITMPQSALTYLPDSGYAVIRQNQPFQQHMVMDAGPLGFGKLAAHGHADALSVFLNVSGQPVLVDSGTWLYLGAGQERDTFRGTAAHNTLIIDGQDQSVPLGPFQWGRRAQAGFEHVFEDDARIILNAKHNGYRKQTGTVHRSVEFDKHSTWILTDTVHGNGLHEMEAFYHMTTEPVLEDQQVICAFDGFQVEFKFECEQAFCIDIQKQPHSPSFGNRQDLPVIVVRLNAQCPFELRTEIRIKNAAQVRV
ncbi:MAG: alginate lyase family protein [candidate division KSB1 bacterium]|nr:alginate lyase family protein [candidate division KSB1 bacterium]